MCRRPSMRRNTFSLSFMTPLLSFHISAHPMATACVNGVLLLCLGIAIIYGIAEKEQRPAQLRQPHQQEHDRHDYETPWYHTRYVPDMRDSSSRLLSSLEERIAEANKNYSTQLPDEQQ